MKIQGKFNEAIVYTDHIDNDSLNQIYAMLNIPAFANSKIRIMPDVHYGKGSVVGFTMTMNEYICPFVVGIDIGCGVDAYNLGQIEVDLPQFDKFLQSNIPSGRNVNDVRALDYFNLTSELENLIQKVTLKHYDRVLKSLGTLGGGNHFIELDKDKEGNVWLLIHSGSRYLGLAVFDYHQQVARNYIKKNFNGASAYYRNEYMLLKNEGAEYLFDMKLTQEYATLNRKVMASVLIEKYFGRKFKTIEHINSIHNYISFEDKIIRKGAISAQKDEMLIIPLNMRDGVIICRGKGSADWNYSAPHGAGRVLSRGHAKEVVSIEEFQQSMHGIYSTSVNTSTIDESPMAYKPAEMIIDTIGDSVEIINVAKPIYNFKSSGA
jgi:RNA-splicing ligase RtcB